MTHMVAISSTLHMLLQKTILYRNAMLTYTRGDRVEFKSRLKQLREGRSMTQEELASLLKVTRQAVGNYEQGNRFPKDENLLKSIADIFDVSLDYLLGRVDKNTKSDKLTDTVVFHYEDKKEKTYQTERVIAFNKILESVKDLPEEAIVKISEVIIELREAFNR